MEEMKKKYRRFANEARHLGKLPHAPPGSQPSCKSCAYILLAVLQPDSTCVKCRQVVQDPVPGRAFGSDHSVVACQVCGKEGEIIFDYWGERPPGEPKSKWFDKRYPQGPLPGEPDERAFNPQDRRSWPTPEAGARDLPSA